MGTRTRIPSELASLTELSNLADRWFNRQLKVTTILLLGNAGAFLAVATVFRDPNVNPAISSVSGALNSFAAGIISSGLALWLAWLQVDFYQDILERAIIGDLEKGEGQRLARTHFGKSVRRYQLFRGALLQVYIPPLPWDLFTE